MAFEITGWSMYFPKNRSKLPIKVKNSVYDYLIKNKKIDCSFEYFINNFDDFDSCNYWYNIDLFNAFGLKNKLIKYSERYWFYIILNKKADFHGNVKGVSKEKSDGIVYDKLLEMGFTENNFTYRTCYYD